MDRTIHFGDDEADARYRIQDTSSTGGDLVLAEDLDGGTVLLEYDYSASEWVSRGPVNLDGNDITNAGSISAGTLEADSSTITDELIADGLSQSTDATSPKELFWFDGPYYSPLFRTAEIDVVADNTANKLINFRGDRHNGLMIVMGSPGDSNNDGFSDVVNFAQLTELTVIDGTSRGTVGLRSYSNDGNSIYVAINDNSITYSVAVILLGAGV